MTIAVICNNVSCESAEELAKAIKGSFFNLQKLKKRDFREFDYVFKYGFSDQIKANHVFNTSKATIRAIDKLSTFKLLEKENITIESTKSLAKAQQWITKGFVVVARQTATGANGEGLAYCESIEQLNAHPALFWTKYFEHTNEFRVNIWKGNVVSIYHKTRRISGNFKFELWQGQEKHPQLVKIAKTIWNNIKLDWCGADILRDESGNLKVLEVNSAPVLYPYTIKKLTSYIKKEISNAED